VHGPLAAPVQDRVGAATLHAPLATSAQHRLGATTLHAPPAASAQPGSPAADVSAAADVQSPPVAPPSSPRRTLELSHSDGVVEISRRPTVVGEIPAQPSPGATQRAGYVEVVRRTRLRPPLKLAIEPTEPVLGGLARTLLSSRVRAWAAAGAAVFVLAVISVSFAMSTDHEEPALGAPPALPSVYRAQPAPYRRQRVEQPPQRDPMLTDVEPKQAEQVDREAARPADETTSPARHRHRDRVHPSPLARGAARLDSSLTRDRTERFDARPSELDHAGPDDGYLVGPLPTKDQF